MLLARRTNEPAKGEWFAPGSRLYKGEALEDAARRVAHEELGLAIELTGQLGVYGHFWDTAALDDVDSRHTVNVVFRAEPTDEHFDIQTDDQHDVYQFFSRPESVLHEYMQQYLLDAR